MNGVFTVAGIRPIRPYMTVSRKAALGETCDAIYFSLGSDTSISRESYDHPVLYIGADGVAVFQVGEPFQESLVAAGQAVLAEGGCLCGIRTETGAVYTEISIGRNSIMNEMLTPGQVFELKDMISYEEGSIANLDVVRNDTMKFVLMAFDQGTGLTPHRAPGNAIVFALEGKAVIGYEGTDHPIQAGECFRFEKNGLHSVTADGRFKMALLLVLA